MRSWAWWPDLYPRGFSTRILDVGCGAGSLLVALRNVGFTNLTGVDRFIEDDVQYGEGVKVMKGGLEDISGQFDLIMFHHSLEHLPDPLGALTDARERLSSAGRVLVRIPVADSWAYAHYGIDWVGLEAPRHLFVYSRRGLRVLAERAGLVLERTIDDSTERQFWASELYRRGVQFQGSYDRWVDYFSADEIAHFRQAAVELNRRGEGDEAAFVLRAAT
jgi:SAM-dependent methyltransferase